jgi:hypothetical protein
MQGTDQPRLHKGRPHGGRWTDREFDEGELGSPLLDSEARADRFAALTEAGYVPAVATRAISDPSRAGGRDEWWSEQFVTAEYGHDAGDYAQMPDDFTPSMGGGQALTGNRRTHRMCYSGAGVKVRMPSATSIKRFDKQTNSTFDIPVSATFDGGSVQGWVRVSRSGDRWEASGLGFPDSADAQVAEAVSAVLEARQPSLALARVGDLAERRRARIEAAGTPVVPLDSSWIEGVAYEDDSSTLVVQTKVGRTYGYSATRDTYEAVAGAMSPGAAYNKLVKGTSRAPVQRCGGCGRFVTDSGHECPTSHAERTGAHFAQNTNAEAAARSLLAPRTAAPPPAPDPAPAVAPSPYGAQVIEHQAYDIDLGTALRALGRQPVLDALGEGGKPLYARRGWTTDVAPALARFTARDYVPHTYRFVRGPMTMPGNAFPEPGAQPIEVNGSNGMVHFDGADAEAAIALAPELPPGNRTEEWNGAPTAGRVLAAVQTNPGRYEFGGYIVGPDRTDERVTIDSIKVYAHTAGDGDKAKVLAEVADMMGGREPDHCELIDIPWRPGERAFDLWWD